MQKSSRFFSTTKIRAPSAATTIVRIRESMMSEGAQAMQMAAKKREREKKKRSDVGWKQAERADALTLYQQKPIFPDGRPGDGALPAPREFARAVRVLCIPQQGGRGASSQ